MSERRERAAIRIKLLGKRFGWVVRWAVLGLSLTLFLTGSLTFFHRRSTEFRRWIDFPEWYLDSLFYLDPVVAFGLAISGAIASLWLTT